MRSRVFDDAARSLASVRGYFILEDIFSVAEVERYRDRLEQYICGRRPLLDGMSHLGTERLRRLELDAVFREMAYHPVVVAAHRALHGTDRLLLAYMGSLHRYPGRDAPKEMHQDADAFKKWYGVEAACKLWNTWVALDDATPDNGCLRFIPGSHRHGLLDAEVVAASRFSASPAVVPEPMRAGSVAFFSGLTMHSSQPTRSAMARRAIGIVPIPREVAYVGDAWAPAEFFVLA
jgi:phytanoyl-CoA hydroxylase